MILLHIQEYHLRNSGGAYNARTLVGQLATKFAALAPDAMVYRPLTGPPVLRPSPTDVTIPLCRISTGWADMCSRILKVFYSTGHCAP